MRIVPLEFEMPLTSFADGRLFGRRYGRPPAKVLALHGWGRSSADFDVVLPGLSAVAVDLPGFGATPPPPAAIGAAGYAESIGPVLDELDEPVVLVGHSFGGRVAVRLAVQRPESVSALVLVGVPLLRRRRRRPPPGYRAVRLARRLRLVPDRVLERARRRYGSPDYLSVTGVMREILVKVVNESYEEELRRLDVPTWLVWGTDDREVPVEVARRAQALLPAAQLVEVAGAGHHLPLEAPEALRKVIVQALSR